MAYSTEQEEFWAGSFGREYIGRNDSPEQLAAYTKMWSDVLVRTGKIGSAIELGPNVGVNLRALQRLMPGIDLRGVEINPYAAAQLRRIIGNQNVHRGSILDWMPDAPSDLSFTSGVLIHIAPERLNDVYDRLYAASSRFVAVIEYYNPAPVAVTYRGHKERLFKRDFAGELLERFPDLKLVDYAFMYRRDPVFPRDDATWFLMEKSS